MATARKKPARAPAVKTKTAPKAPRSARPAKAAPAAGPDAAGKAPKAAATKSATKAPTTTAKVPKAEKPRKPKLVRDSFTIPKAEYTVLQEMKDRATKLGKPVKKSELLRAGVQALAAMSDEAFTASVSAVPALKTGRPAKV